MDSISLISCRTDQVDLNTKVTLKFSVYTRYNKDKQIVYHTQLSDVRYWIAKERTHLILYFPIQYREEG